MQTTSNSRSLFRENALASLDSMNDIAVALNVVAPTAWMSIIVSLLGLIGFLIWVFCAKISMSVAATGITLPAGYLEKIELSYKKYLQDKEDKLAVYKYLFDKKSELFKKNYITIVELEKAKEDYFLAKDEWMLSQNGGSILENNLYLSGLSDRNIPTYDALVFINHMDGKKIHAGMNVYVRPNTFSVYEYGYIKGKIIDVSDYPVTKQIAYSYLENMNLVDQYFMNDVPFMAKIKFDKKSSTASGLAWTTRDGAPFVVQSGTPVSVDVVTGVCYPYQLLLKNDVCRW